MGRDKANVLQSQLKRTNAPQSKHQRAMQNFGGTYACLPIIAAGDIEQLTTV